MSKDYKICPVCFGNGEVRQEERNPIEVIAEQKELLDKMADAVNIIMCQDATIRLLREDGERLFAITAPQSGWTDDCKNEVRYQHNALLKQLDEQDWMTTAKKAVEENKDAWEQLAKE